MIRETMVLLAATASQLCFGAGDEWFLGQVYINGPSPITYDLTSEVSGPSSGGTISLTDTRLSRCWGSSQQNPPVWTSALTSFFSTSIPVSGTYTYAAIGANEKRVMQSKWNLKNTRQEWGHDYYKVITYYSRYREDRSFIEWTDRLTAK